MHKVKFTALIALSLSMCACDAKSEGSSGDGASGVSGAVTNLVNSSHKEEYPADAVASFMNSCVSTGSDAKSCSCVIGKIQKDIPFKEFAEADVRVLAGESPGENLIKAMTSAKMACQ